MEPNRIYQAFITSGNEWAEAQYAYQQLDDQSKSILAHLTLEAKDIEGVKSMAEASTIALAATEYRNHLSEVAKARLIYTKAKVAYDATKALFDAQRTLEASERAANRSAT